MKKTHQEYQYLDLMQEVLDHGIKKVDRGTDIVLYSLFGRQIRFDLSKDFPLLTTKKVYWKGVLHELYWFMSGQTNIKYLVDNNVHIWDDYPYKIYCGKFKSQISNSKSQMPNKKIGNCPSVPSSGSREKLEIGNSEQKNAKLNILTKEEFMEKIRTNETFARRWGDLPRIYGEMWRKWPTHSASSGQARTKRTIDQLKWVLQELKDDPDAKNLIVNSWNPEYLYTMATHKDASRFPICHNMYQISNRNGKLSLQLYHRSADLFLGVPFNIASYALLTIILAQIAGLKPGEFIHTFGDVHIYKNHVEQVKEQLARKPNPFPTLKIAPIVKKLEDFRPEHVELTNYDPYPSIKAELTVAGGLYDPKTGRMSG